MRTRAQGMEVCGNRVDGYRLANTRAWNTNATINKTKDMRQKGRGGEATTTTKMVARR
jgi:hypothetical protein